MDCFLGLRSSDKLTILNIAWPPFMTVYPHNHGMWAVIGVYSGGEDNIFWRRHGDVIEAAGAKSLRVGDAAPLGRDIIHTVTNPIGRDPDRERLRALSHCRMPFGVRLSSSCSTCATTA